MPNGTWPNPDWGYQHRPGDASGKTREFQKAVSMRLNEVSAP